MFSATYTSVANIPLQILLDELIAANFKHDLPTDIKAVTWEWPEPPADHLNTAAAPLRPDPNQLNKDDEESLFSLSDNDTHHVEVWVNPADLPVICIV